MNRFQTYGLCGLAGVSVLATLDSALGLGGSAFLADICMTLIEGESATDGGMADMPMEIKPVPLIAISMAATGAAIYALTRDHQRAQAGLSEPDDEERAAILSAMIVVVAAQGRTSREEIRDVFRIVTNHDLSEELLNLAYVRSNSLVGHEGAADLRLPPVSTTIGRRRSLAAAMILGYIARPASDAVSELIERIALDIGATSADTAAAQRSLDEWQSDFAPMKGVSPVTVLRHRSLRLAPA